MKNKIFKGELFMKRFKLIFVFLIFAQFCFSNTKAQISISASFLSNIEVFFLNDLNLTDPGSSPAWIQVIMVNPGQPANVFLEFEFHADGERLASGTTLVFSLQTGTTVITNQNLGASPYEFDDYAIEENNATNLAQQIAQLGALPSKVYQLFIRIYDAGNSSLIVEIVPPLTISPQNPTLVQLISPGIPNPQSQSEIPIIYVTNPTFSWDTNSNDITLIVVEWLDGEGQQEAFDNPQKLIDENLTGGANTFTPQSGFFPFEASKVYLWRLQLNVPTPGAVNSDSYTSEAYAFKIGSPGDAGNAKLDIIKGLLVDLYGQDVVDSWFSDSGELVGFVPSGVFLIDGKPSSLADLTTAIENLKNQQTSSTIQ